jgi:MscS family membrane protein
MRGLLGRHPKVDPNVARVRFIGIGDNSLEIEIHCHLLAGTLERSLAIREELLMRIIELICNSGIDLAVPTRELYMQQDQALRNEPATPPGNARVLRHGT